MRSSRSLPSPSRSSILSSVQRCSSRSCCTAGSPGPSIVLLPLVILVHVVFTTAVALLLARWNLFYRDVKYLFEVVIVVWMFATSVVYPVGLVGGRLGVVMQLNPMTPIVEAYRSVLLLGTWPPAGPLAAVGLLSVAFLAWSWVAFHRSEFEFAENI